jgi:hypothetical protein
MSPDRARRIMRMLMLGPALSGQGVPEWPLGRNHTRDEAFLAALANYLELDERGYNELVIEMWELSPHPQVRSDPHRGHGLARAGAPDGYGGDHPGADDRMAMRRVCSEPGCPDEAISKGRCAEIIRVEQTGKGATL